MTSDHDMPGGSLPAHLDPPAVPPSTRPFHKRRWPYVAVLLGALLIAAATLVPTPYYLFEPGSVRATEPHIEVTGHRAYDPNGSIYFTTVGIRRATLTGLIQGWLDDAIEVQSDEEAYPAGTRRERVINRQLMDDSKLNATYVAFRTVGYPVTPTGTGAFVDDVMPDFPASGELAQGDVITAVDGQQVRLASELGELLKGRPVGAAVTLEVRSAKGRSREVVTTLGRNRKDPSRGYLGVAVSTADQDIELPFGLDIDAGNVTGPSAGLAWTLGLIDRLTPGDLAGGRKVAVTGTIDPEGRVGPIGGILQKIAAVKRSGIGEFIYPAATPAKEQRKLRRIAGGDVELHPVATLEDALKVMAPDGLPPAPPLS